jgi:predicted Fe-Mo cluster-binding NifX family protein
VLVAVPSEGSGGLEAERSGHFGRCDCFTLVEIGEGVVKSVSVIDNPPHAEGGCLRPVGILSAQGADAIIVAGIGGRPLAGFGEAGISVYFDDQTPAVGDVVKRFIDGDVEPIEPGRVCSH